MRLAPVLPADQPAGRRPRRIAPWAPWLGVACLAWAISRALWTSPPNPSPPEWERPAPSQGLPAAFDAVVIDPGHGGNDNGASGHGLQEKSLTLDLGRRLSEILLSSGLNALLTRTEDVYVPLGDRVDVGRAAPRAIFVSLHCNSSDAANAHGVEVYAATRKACGDGTVVQTRTGPETLPACEQRLSLAVAESLGNALRCEHHESKHADFFVIRNLAMPAILVECGFLTNADDARALADPAYRERVAEAVAAGILAYRRSVTREPLTGELSVEAAGSL